MVNCSVGFDIKQTTGESGSNVSAQSILLKILERLGDQGIPYAVLTPRTEQPPSVSSDVDLAFSSDPRSTIEPILLEIQEQGEIQILHRLHYEVPAGYLYIVSLCRANDLQLLRLDCLCDPHGTNYLWIPMSFVVAGRVKEWWGYRANDRDLAIYFLLKWALKGNVPKVTLPQDKLTDIQGVLQRAGRVAVEREGRRLLGEDSGHPVREFTAAATTAEAEAALGKLWRIWGDRRWRTHPIQWFQRNFWNVLRLAHREIRPTGIFMVLLGPDGCGKSTLADAIGNRLSPAFRRNWRFHWRPGLLPKLSGKDKKPNCPTMVEPPREASYGTLVSLARYLYYLVDFVVGYWARLYPRRAATTLVIGERWHYDVIVNPQRYGFRLPKWLLRMGQRFIPRPDLIFFLTAEPEVIHARKPELTVAEIRAQVDDFRSILQGEPGVVEVDTGTGVTETIRCLQEAILRETSACTNRRLGDVPEWLGFGPGTDPKVWRHRDDKASQALRLYHPASLKGRLAKYAASLLPRLLSDRCFFRARPSAVLAAGLSQHVRVIQRVLGEPSAVVSFATGTPGPHRKMVAQATVDGSVRAYVKIDLDNTLAGLLDTEARALSTVDAAHGIMFRCPKLLADVKEHHYRYLFLSGPEQDARPRPLKPDRLDQLFLEYWAGSDSSRIPVEEILSKLPAVPTLEGSETQILADALEFVRSAFRDTGVKVCPSHGDYAPWNTLILRDGSLYVFDWEYFNEQAPALQDAFHLIFMPGRLVKGLPPGPLVRRLLSISEDQVLGRVVESAGISGKELPAYLLFYFLEMIRRQGWHDASSMSYLINCMRLVLLKVGFAGYRRRVLVSAYACEPGKGSEPGVGWHWVQAISRDAEVWVITKGNNRVPIEQELGSKPCAGLHFEYVELPRWLTFWKKGERGVRLYYYLWQFAALARARRLLRSNDFDIGHHVTFVNDRVWTFLSLLSIPFVWGPIGSNSIIPRQLLENRRTWLRDVGKRSLQSIVRLIDPLYWLSVVRAARILCINETVARSLPLQIAARRKIVIEPAIAIEEPQDAAPPAMTGQIGEQRGISVLFVGKFITIKGPDLALEAFAEFASKTREAHFTLVGEGPLARSLKRRTIDLGLTDRVSFVPWLPRDEVLRLFQAHDVFLFPSLEGGGMVVLEAMAAGLPVICLDFGGPGQMVTSETGIKVPVGQRAEVIHGLAQSLFHIIHDDTWLGPAVRQRIQQTVQSRFSWQGKERLIAELYQAVT